MDPLAATAAAALAWIGAARAPDEPPPPAPGLFEARGSWSYTARAAVEGARVLVPLPLDDREQVPLAFELEVEPAEALSGAGLLEDRPGQWVVELALAPLAEGDQVALGWRAAVLVGPSSFDGVPRRAPYPDAWPEEARPWLAATRYAEADHPRILEIAEAARGRRDDVLDVIRRTLVEARNVRARQSGRCTQLGAVEALDREGSCTSAANLLAALLRAAGIPARIVAGYATWYGPHQTHYVVEAFVPGHGWYPIEPTRLEAPWDPCQQVQVAIVPPAYEDRAFPRFFAAGGVPYLSLTEVPAGGASLSFRGTIEAGRNADHVARLRQRYGERDRRWDEALERAREHWRRWLASEPRAGTGGRLATPLSPDEDPRGPADVVRLLEGAEGMAR